VVLRAPRADIQIATQKRPLFGSRKRREIRLDRIQTVSVEQPRRVQVILGFGTVVVEAAGNRPEFWHGLPNPGAVWAAILEAEERYIDQREAELRRQVQEAALQATGGAGTSRTGRGRC